MSSVCLAEIERKPEDTWATRVQDLCRPSRIFPMAHLDLTHTPGKPFEWLDSLVESIAATWANVPEEHRWLILSGTGKDFPVDQTFSQVHQTRLKLDLRSLVTRGIFVDSEELWPDKFTRQDYFRSCCSPLGAPIALWNHVLPDPSGAIPCKYWAGNFMGEPIGELSNPETYVGWYTPTMSPEVLEENSWRNEPAELWRSWIRCINAIRSALCDSITLPHLPTAHPDIELSEWYTRETIIHARLAGCTKFLWATYMCQDPKRMADVIASALERADSLALRSTTLFPYRSKPIAANARSVSTRGYTTRRP